MSCTISGLKQPLEGMINAKILQTGDQTDVDSPWKSLPKDVMEMIARCLNSTAYVRCAAVCKSWRSLLLYSDVLGPQDIWILVPQRFRSDIRTLEFFNVEEAKVHAVALPEPIRSRGIHGSSRGWLVIVEHQVFTSQIHLYNPMSRDYYELPLLPSTTFLGRVELSSSYVSDCAVAVILNFEELALCKIGDQWWEIIPFSSVIGKNCRLIDILFHHRKLHVLIKSSDSDDGKIEDLTVELPDRGESVSITLIQDLDERNIDSTQVDLYTGHEIRWKEHQHSYLVESIDGRVMLIHKLYSQFCLPEVIYELDNEEVFHNKFRVNTVTEFTVMVVEDSGSGRKRLRRRKGLGKEQELFLSAGSRFCLPATESGNLQGNRAYSLMDLDYPSDEEDGNEPYLVDACGVYCFDAATVCPEIGVFPWGCPTLHCVSVWLVPNFQPSHGLLPLSLSQI